MGTVVLDADLVIGFLEPRDALHDDAVRSLRPWLAREHRRIICASAYSETLVRPIAGGSDVLVDEFVDLGLVDVAPVDRRIARTAAELRAHHRTLRLPDALTLAVALEHEAELLTFDRRLRRIARDER